MKIRCSLNSCKTLSFSVSKNKKMLAGGIKKDVVYDKQKTKTDMFRGKETENCSDFGEGDTL